MCDVVLLGVYAFKKYGPDNVTLYQLSQAEDEGLWPPSEVPACKALVSCLVTARSKIKVTPRDKRKLTQMRHTSQFYNQ